jgi:hypothetical protein
MKIRFLMFGKIICHNLQMRYNEDTRSIKNGALVFTNGAAEIGGENR